MISRSEIRDRLRRRVVDLVVLGVTIPVLSSGMMCVMSAGPFNAEAVLPSLSPVATVPQALPQMPTLIATAVSTPTPRPTLTPLPTATPTPTVSAVVWKKSDIAEVLSVGGGFDPPVFPPAVVTPIATPTAVLKQYPAGTVIVLCLGVGPSGTQNRAHAFPADIDYNLIELPCGDMTATFSRESVPKG